LRRVPMLAPEQPRGYKYPTTFEVDLTAPQCVKPLNQLHDLEAVV